MKSKTWVLLGRLMRNIMRSPDTIITVAIADYDDAAVCLCIWWCDRNWYG